MADATIETGHLSLSLPITKFSILNLVLNLVYMYTTPVYYTTAVVLYILLCIHYMYIYIYIYI
jgi:uncharacterized protein YhhL (DUF1145 family)